MPAPVDPSPVVQLPESVMRIARIIPVLGDFSSDDPVIHAAAERIAVGCLLALEDILTEHQEIRALIDFYSAAVDVLNQTSLRKRGG